MPEPDKRPEFVRGSSHRLPTECQRCWYEVSGTMMAEARMIALREGEMAAKAFFNEKLEDRHAGH